MKVAQGEAPFAEPWVSCGKNPFHSAEGLRAPQQPQAAKNQTQIVRLRSG